MNNYIIGLGDHKFKLAFLIVVWIIFIFYLYLLLRILILKGDSIINVINTIVKTRTEYDFSRYLAYRANFIPFKSIIQFLSNISMFSIVNLCGNIIAFIPLGLLLPVVFNSSRKYWIFILATLFIGILVETLQFVFQIGNVDIDDIILYLLGGTLGYIFFIKIILRMIPLFYAP